MTGLILYEDEHLLVVNKPSGINTHQPDRYAPEGIHEWLTRRRGAGLAILHRLDKDTSGVLLFGKSRVANQSLTQQFTAHRVRKTYLLLSDRRPTRAKCQARTPGAETDFEYAQPVGDWHLIVARPATGKTHQVRRHAADRGFPILGDTEYGGAPAARLLLHAYRIEFEHPATRQPTCLAASVPDAFEDADPLVAAREFRSLLFGAGDTDCYRLISGAADGFPEAIVDWYDGIVLVQWQRELPAEARQSLLDRLRDGETATAVRGEPEERAGCPHHEAGALRCVYEQLATRQQRGEPQLVSGLPLAAGERVPVRENGVTFLVGFGAGLASGLFLDQRETRWQLRQRNLSGKTILNCFAYTATFSVVAALAGAVTTSVDLSRQYLDWGRENFRANGLDPAAHDFIYGDVFDWLKRFTKKGRRWDGVILDPPTFSTTRGGRSFQAERGYGELVRLALPLIESAGWLFCSTNQRTFAPSAFEQTLRDAVVAAGRTIADLAVATQPFDFRTGQGERAYLKTCWVRLAD